MWKSIWFFQKQSCLFVFPVTFCLFSSVFPSEGESSQLFSSSSLFICLSLSPPQLTRIKTLKAKSRETNPGRGRSAVEEGAASGHRGAAGGCHPHSWAARVALRAACHFLEPRQDGSGRPATWVGFCEDTVSRPIQELPRAWPHGRRAVCCLSK